MADQVPTFVLPDRTAPVTQYKTFLLIAGLMASFPGLAQDTRPLREVLAMLDRATAARCQAARQTLAAAPGPGEKDAAQLAVELACDCLPPETRRRAEPLGGSDSDTPVSQSQAAALSRAALFACMGPAVRRQAVDVCLRAKLDDQAARCACVSSAIARVPDEALTHASLAMTQHLERSAAARARGESAPPPQATVIDEIMDRCVAGARGGPGGVTAR